MAQSMFSGAFTALATPFKGSSLEVDFKSFETLIEHQLSAGINGVVVCGSTGEAATLTDSEYKQVIERAVKIIGKRTTVIGGVGTSSTARAIELAKLNETLGVDAIMVVTPPYNKPTQDGLVAHFMEVRKATKLPIMAYNVPGRTGCNLLPATVQELVRKRAIDSIKEASGSMDQILDLLQLLGGSLPVLSGDDSFTHSVMAAGGNGVVSVVSNSVPELVLNITNAALSGDFAESLTAHRKILPLCRAMFAETNPIPVKAALAILGIFAEDSVRLPLLPAKDPTKQKLAELLPGRRPTMEASRG